MSEMIGFTAYQKYLSIMMHFNDKINYDYFKYNGKTSVKLETFKKNKSNVYKYAGIEKRVGFDELETFFFVNMEDGYKKFIPQMWYKHYKKCLDRINMFDVEFDDDLYSINEMIESTGCGYKDLFNGGEFHLHPLLYVWYDKGMVSKNTVMFIDAYISSIFEESHSCDPLLWKEVVDKHRQVTGFYRRCYFSRLHDMDEMKKFGQNKLLKHF
jgi:hypothetical protein